MSERLSNDGDRQRMEARIEKGRDFLNSYPLCMDMLDLRRYERKRGRFAQEMTEQEDILSGNEAYWRARMFEVKALVDRMKNGREKLILYYHYIRGESIEHIANTLGISRRTGYRLHQRALYTVACLLEREQRDKK